MKNLSLSLEALDPFFDKVSKLSKVQRILICVLVLILIVAPAVYFLYIPKHRQINTLTADYEKLAADLAEAKRKARGLNKFRAEIKKLEAQFGIAKKALPESEEIPSLLTSVSHSGQDAGLEFLLFKPEKEGPRGFYAEIPVSVKVVGSYHEAVLFFDRVSRLSRIVNIRDIRISAYKEQNRRQQRESEENKLEIACTAVTYKFIESAPEKAESEKK